jgi:hypothetical protein
VVRQGLTYRWTIAVNEIKNARRHASGMHHLGKDHVALWPIAIILTVSTRSRSVYNYWVGT